ncbi:MAG: TlpA family protein disulfide reductase [Bacteroidia bacterium]|nr:TlpA family protein disulfide reductase [Bacteroidia bacterium]
MFKKIFILLLIFSSDIRAQYTIKGHMDPQLDYSWVALYQLQGAKQNYKANTRVNKGDFTLIMPTESEKGIYRLLYDLENRLFVDIIYNDENISFTFNPRFPNKKIKFNESEENILYQNYLDAITEPQHQLDSLQVVYFNSNDIEERDHISQLYYINYTQLINTQQHFERISEGKLAQHFIKASARYNSAKPISEPTVYLEEMKIHFFDFLDLNNPVLLNSTFINDKINDYIFYLNTSEDNETLNKLQKEAITIVLNKIRSNDGLTKDIEEGLLYTFAQQENIEMVNFLINQYLLLPKDFQDVPFINEIKFKLKTAVGMLVPNISWTQNNTNSDLYGLNKANVYIVVFWSSTCSHCLKEMPVLYDYVKNNQQTQVIAVGLEDDDSKTGWQQEITKYPKFINIYGENKWENKHAIDYGVNATPTFFVLDAKKKVLAKPDNVDELKLFFEKHLKN